MSACRAANYLCLFLAACHGTNNADSAALDAGVCSDVTSASGSGLHAVLTQHNDNARTGATLSETELTPCTVSTLVDIGSYALDGEAYAQPLYAEHVATASGPKNLLLVATMADSLFAFDAAAPGSDPVWQLGREGELGAPAFSSRNIAGNNGILATPVIDADSAALYLVSRDCEPSFPANAPHCEQRLFEIELGTGKVLQSIAVSGSAMTQDQSTPVFFDPSLHWSRAALLLTQGIVFLSFGSGPNGNAHEEDFPYHGWLFGYSAADFTIPPSVYCSTADFGGGAIWQSGAGPAADDDAIYFASGNGIHQPTPLAPLDFPTEPQADEDSLVRVPLSAAETATHYWDDRPYHADGNVFQYMEKNDIDLGTSGPLLIPDSNTLVIAGKSGIVYVLDRATLALAQEPLEVFTAPPLSAGQSKYIYSYDGGPHVHGSPTFFRASGGDASAQVGSFFLWPAYDRLTRFGYDYATGLVSKLLVADVPVLSSGGTLSLSARGGAEDSAILWASAIDSDGSSGHLWAFSASTLARLWDAKLPAWAKFAVPTIANGRVYLASTSSKAGTTQEIRVFGLSR